MKRKNIHSNNAPTTAAKPRRPRAAPDLDPLVLQVGMRIRSLRNAAGMNLRDFGAHAKVHPFHVMAVELGHVSASTTTLNNIAKGLGVSVADLLIGNQHEPHDELAELLRQHPELVQRAKDLLAIRQQERRS